MVSEGLQSLGVGGVFAILVIREVRAWMAPKNNGNNGVMREIHNSSAAIMKETGYRYGRLLEEAKDQAETSRRIESVSRETLTVLKAIHKQNGEGRLK